MKKIVAIERLREFYSVLRNEYKYIFTDAGVILILFGAIVIYSTAYSFAYKNEVLRDVPIAVVDDSHSPMSREFTRKLDATPNIVVAYKPQSLEQAKEMFLKREVNGIVVIPKGFEKDILSNKKAYFAVYADAGYFLYYKQVFSDITAAMTNMNDKIEVRRFTMAGLSQPQAVAVSDPVKVTSRSLFNPYNGYGTFVMPAILILIIQQTLLIGIGMIGGTWREQKLFSRFVQSGKSHMSALPIVLGKGLAYFSISILTLSYVFGFHYKAFGYPMNGSALNIVAFLLPYVLSVIFLGIALSSVFKHRENSLIILLFTSIPFLMLSGVSVPVEAMPTWLYEFGKIIPSSSAINGFIRLQTMGADLSDVIPELETLWILTGVYFLLACLGMRRLARMVD